MEFLSTEDIIQRNTIVKLCAVGLMGYKRLRSSVRERETQLLNTWVWSPIQVQAIEEVV